MMKRFLAIAIIILNITSCGKNSKQEQAAAAVEQMQEIISAVTAETQAASNTEGKETETMLELTINGTPISVNWEDNESVQALRKLTAKETITVQMSMYGGFEQVGPLGTGIVRNDKQTTATAGDIVLYSGSNIVIFYGSNSWAYTRLGRITGMTDSELAELLGNGDVTAVLSLSQ